MEPSDRELYDQLLGYLAAEGEIEERQHDGVIVLTEFHHRPLEQPLRLHITPSTFGQHLEDAASNSAGLYPDIPPLDAAWRLFTIHLDEAVQSARPGETELVLGRGGVDSRRPDMTRAPFHPEVESHIALEEYTERLIQRLADQGELEIDVDDEVLLVHLVDGRRFTTPLRVQLPSQERRRQMWSGANAETTWRAIVDQIRTLALSVDPEKVALELTPAGVVAKDR